MGKGKRKKGRSNPYLFFLIILSSLAFADWQTPDHVYNMEQDPSTSNLTDIVGSMDFTSHSGIGWPTDTISGTNRAWNTSPGTPGWVDMALPFMDNNGSICVSWWSNAHQGVSSAFQWTYNNGVINNAGGVFWSGGGAWNFRITTDNIQEAGFSVPDNDCNFGTWCHWVWTYDGSRMYGYVSNIQKGSVSATGNIKNDGNLFTLMNNADGTHGKTWEGAITHFYVYEEYNCSISDVNNIYTEGTSNNNFYPYIVSDTTPPNITIDDPAQGEIVIGNAEINVTIDEAGECYTNNTAFILQENTTTTFRWRETTLPNANYNILISCNDTSDNEATATLNFSKASPLVTVFSPQNGDTILGVNITTIFEFEFFDPNECSLYSNVTGPFTLEDQITTGALNITEFINITNYFINTSEMLHAFRFEENGGSVAIDEVENANGTVFGSFWVDSRQMNGTGTYAINLTGSDYINVPNQPYHSFGTSNDFSISVWIRNYHYMDPSYHMIVDNRDASNDGVFLATASGQEVQLSIDTVQFTSTTTINDDDWHFIVAVADRDSATISDIYIDGVAENVGAISSGVSVDVTSDLFIGRRAFSSGIFWEGTLDELVIWNKTLNSSQILELYHNGINESEIITIENTTTVNQTLNQSTNYTLVNIPADTLRDSDIEHFVNCQNGFSVNSSFFTVTFDNDFTAPTLDILTINLTYNETYNQDIWINFTSDEFVTCSINDTSFSLFSTNGSIHSWRETTLDNDFYTVRLNCTDLSLNINTVEQILYFTKDKEFPFIELLLPSNASGIVNTGEQQFIFNLTDNNDLWDFHINFTFLDPIFGETLLYSEVKNLSGEGTQAFYNEIIPTGNWTNNTLITVGTTLCDSHTKNSIARAKSVSKQKSHIVWDFGDYWIRIQSMSGGEDGTNSRYLNDKYDFSFNYNSPTAEKKFKITSNRVINHLPRSDFKAHFVVGNHWVDFESLSTTLVEQECNYEPDINATKCDYFITVYNPDSSLTFSSVGELNCNIKYFEFTLLGEDAEEGINIFNLDFSTIAGVLILAVLLIAYLSCMAMGFTFKNFGFASLGFFFGVIIGIILAPIHMLLTLVMFLLNIWIFYKYSSMFN